MARDHMIRYDDMTGPKLGPKGIGGADVAKHSSNYVSLRIMAAFKKWICLGVCALFVCIAFREALACEG